MSSKDKLIKKLKSKPKDFTWDELTRLFGALNLEETIKGKTGGSRRKFYHLGTGLIINLHKPHPTPIIKSYLIEQIIKKTRRREFDMTRSDLIFYKDYYGSVHFDPQEELFFGKIEFIRDLVNYEASEAKSLIKAFHEAVDSYLEDCNNLAKTPDKPFKGSFNVRVDPELHKEVSLYALQHGDTLNGVVRKALNVFIKGS